MKKKINKKKNPVNNKKTFKNKITSFIKNIYTLAVQNKYLTALIIIAFIIRFIGLLPHDIYNADEAYIRKFSGDIFFNIVTKFDFDPHTFKYGTFIFYLGALAYFPILFIRYILEIIQIIFFPVGTQHLVSFSEFISHIGSFHNDLTILWLQRFLVSLFGVLSCYLLYKIGKQLFSKEIGLLSGFLLAVSPLHSRDSHYLTTDIPFTFFILLSIYFMIKLFQTNKLKWYIFTGLAIGLSTTIRYFPLAALPYPIAVLLTKEKNIHWFLKVVIGIICMVVGIFIGVPHLILKHENQILFQQEMARYVLPWYQTTLTIYLSELLKYITTLGKNTLPQFSSLYPVTFKPVYITLLFFQGVGPVAFLLAIIGIFISIFRNPKKLLFLIILPLFLFIYLGSYIPARYDRLGIPLLPFLALFTSISVIFFFEKIKLRSASYQLIAIVIVTISIYVYPFSQSALSSWECSKKHPFDVSVDWINANIPENSKIAFKTHLPFPSKSLTGYEILPTRNFYLEEARNLGADYAFINTYTVLTYFMSNLPEDFFIIPQDLYQNYYVVLSLNEYKTRANLLYEIKKPVMCAQPDLSYYKLPPLLADAQKLIKQYTFLSKNDLNNWKILHYPSQHAITNLTFSSDEGNNKKGAIAISWKSFDYVPERIVSNKIAVKPNKIYTLKAYIKPKQSYKDDLDKGIYRQDGFLRLDFYSAKNNNTILPGEKIALTPRFRGDSQWKELKVTTKAPPDAKFATISLSSNGVIPNDTFYFDDIELLEN